ncbi:acyltransferase [Brevundimonas diminuta]|uniref:acyltransferase n=1 Tax=Brevundimonas diminuta TaxID=293 RepID=UPI0037C73F2A
MSDVVFMTNEACPVDFIKLDSRGSDAVRVVGGAGNAVYVHKDACPGSVHVEFHGDSNELWIGSGCRLRGSVHFYGSNGVAHFGSSGELNVSASIYDGSSLHWGDRSTAYHVRVWVHGGRRCRIGDGCLFSENIHIRTSDHHSIIDLKRGALINEAADVTVGNHVWISEGVRIGKGARIGAGSIIAGSSFVNGEVPPCELWGGVPARRIRSDVSWVNEFPASAASIESLIRREAARHEQWSGA